MTKVLGLMAVELNVKKTGSMENEKARAYRTSLIEPLQ